MEESDAARVHVAGDVRGQVVVGDHNIVVSATGQSVVTVVGQGQRPSPRPREEIELLPRRARRAVGRESELAFILEGMAADDAVQVHGPSGIGKSTLLRMAAHRLVDERAVDTAAGGTVFIDAGGREPGDVLQDVFEACYDAPGYRPGQAELRRLMARVGIRLILDDLECGPQELAEALDTLPEAAVLFSGAERTLWGEGRTLALSGLPRDDAVTLLTQALARPLRGEEVPVAEALWDVTAGSPQWLLRAATTGGLARPAALAELLTGLLAALTTPERVALVLLRLGGAGGVSDGLLSELVGSGAELSARLTTLGLAEPTGDGFRISHDLAAVRSADREVDAAALADRLSRWVDAPGRSPAQVARDGGLITAVIEAAVEAGAAPAAVRLARAAAPTVACSLRLGVWGTVLDRGIAAAQRARDQHALAYFTHENGVRDLVSGKRAAAGAAFATAGALWQQLGDSGNVAVSQHAQSLCGPGVAPPPDAGLTTPDPTAGDLAGVTPDASSVLGSLPPPDPASAVAAASTAAGQSAGIGLTAKLVIGAGLTAAVAGGTVLNQQSASPDTVPVHVTVATGVIEVTMPGEPEPDCRIEAGATDCTTVVISEEGERGPVTVDPAGPLPEGVSVLYWGCDEGPEAASCTVLADRERSVCVTTTSPDDEAARQACADVTGSPAPRDRAPAEVVADVGRCPEDSAYPVEEEEIPETVRLSDSRYLPSGTAVVGVWDEPEPLFFVGPEGSSCFVTGGATGLRYLEMGSDAGRVSSLLNAGGVVPATLYGCEYVDPAEAYAVTVYPDRGTDCARPLGHDVEQVSTGTPDYHAALVHVPAGDPTLGPDEGSTVELYLYTVLAESEQGHGRSIACSLPDADMCVASLTYFLAQDGERAGMRSADRERMTENVTAFVERYLS